MSRSNILLTGATGFVGFRVLILALEAGYPVRCVVRSEAKAVGLLNNSVIERLSRGALLSISIVSDFTSCDAFEEAIRDISYIIHVASPVPAPEKTDWQLDLIEPAVKGTTELLKAAKSTDTVQRIVITSSVAGIVPYPILTHGDTTDKVWTPDDRIPIDRGPYENHTQAYNASKAVTLKAIAHFMESEKPKFDVINIFPGWVIGRNDLAKSPTGTVGWTNWAAVGNVFGHCSKRATAAIPGHIDDVAQAHILALDSKIQGNQNFGVCFDSDWSLSLDIVKRRFPQAVEAGIFPLNGNQPDVKLRFDSSKTEEVLGLKFFSLEEQVVSVASHYLEELAKPGAQPVDPDALQI